MHDPNYSRLIKLAHIASLVRRWRSMDTGVMQKSAYGYYQTPQQARTAAHVQQLVENKRKRHEERVANAPYVQAQKNLNHQRILDRRAAEQAAKNGDRALYDQYLMDEQAGKYIADSPYYATGGLASQIAVAQAQQQPSSAIQAQQQAQGTTESQATSSSTPSGASLSAYKGNGEWDFPSDYTPEQIQEAKQMQQNAGEYSSAIEKYNEETGNPIQNVESVQVTNPDGSTEYEIRGDAQTNWLNEVNSGADAIGRGEPPEWLGGTTDQNLPEVDMNAGTGRTDEPVKPHGVTPLPSSTPTQSQPQSQAQTALGTPQTQAQSAPTASTTPPATTASPAAAPRPSAVQRQQAQPAQRTPTTRDPNKLRDTAFLHRDGFQVRPGDMAATEAARVAPAQRAMFQQVEQENKRNSPADPQLNTYQYWAQPNPVTNAFNKANPTANPRPAAGVGSSMSSTGSAPLGGGPVGPQPINLNKRVNVPGITNKKKMNKPAPLE